MAGRLQAPDGRLYLAVTQAGLRGRGSRLFPLLQRPRRRELRATAELSRLAAALHWRLRLDRAYLARSQSVPDCEFCGYIAANQGFPAGSMRKAKVRRATVGSNRHPADEMGEVRERIAEFEEREAELREILIAATEAERVGEEWIAHVSEQHRKLLDREALTEHFGVEALQPFMHESVATMLRLKDAHTGRQRRRRRNSGGRPQRTDAPDRPECATSRSASLL